ncbi:MAG: 2-(1,2-epoxy-1,2-dihydrophenyl)acetyl-CoA isomerase PaaG [Alphaproteobacteria bacterium]
MKFEHILYAKRDATASITLNRPDKLNAFNVPMLEELLAAVTDAASDAGVRAVLLTGAGRGFCAGADLESRRVPEGGQKPDLGKNLLKWYNPVVKTIRTMEKPVVVAVNGVCAGAGAGIATAGDIVLAARSASFIQAFCKIGLVPDAGNTWHLPRLIGVARARGLALLGDKLPAEQAEQWGLIWKCVDDAKLMEEATAILRQFASAPTRALAYSKALYNASFSNDLATQMDLEAQFQRRCGDTADFWEGVKAFLEKRKPDFKGR